MTSIQSNERLKLHCAGRAPIYVCTRLFEHSGRDFGLHLAAATERGTQDALATFGLPVSGPLVFLPFRDSNEAVALLPTSDSLSKRIYAADIAQLDAAPVIVASIGDLHYDSGICFELGYSFAKGIPVLLLITNFFHVTNCAGVGEYAVEDLFRSCIPNIIIANELDRSDGNTTYAQRVAAAIAECEVKLRQAVYNVVVGGFQKTQISNTPKTGGGVFLEFGGGRFEFQRILTKSVSENLETADLLSYICRRNSPNILPAVDDLAALTNSDVCVFFCDGCDVDPETAFLVGVAKAFQKRIILYRSDRKRLKTHEGYNVQMNLMISESGEFIVDNLQGIQNAVIKSLKK